MLGIGTKVKFRTTPDSGIITDKLGDGMVMVQLDDVDMEIPAFEEDLVRVENFMQIADFQRVNKIELPPKTVRTNTSATVESPNNLYVSLDSVKPVFTNGGIQLAFYPYKNKSGEIEKFDVFLLNDTAYAILFECDFLIFNENKWSKEGKINAVNFEKLGQIVFDDINDLPEFDFTFSPIYTEGVGEKVHKTLKIKMKQFFKNFKLSEFLSHEVYLFTLLEKFETSEPTTKDDLQQYTKDLISTKNPFKKQDSNLKPAQIAADVNEYATFINEIDLHIELLHNNPNSLTNMEIIAVQIKAFETYLSKAIRLGIPRVYIIHGVGKGKLKDMIHARLRKHPDVEWYKNEYHERYGWGATEVTILKW